MTVALRVHVIDGRSDRPDLSAARDLASRPEVWESGGWDGSDLLMMLLGEGFLAEGVDASTLGATGEGGDLLVFVDRNEVARWAAHTAALDESTIRQRWQREPVGTPGSRTSEPESVSLIVDLASSLSTVVADAAASGDGLLLSFEGADTPRLMVDDHPTAIRPLNVKVHCWDPDLDDLLAMALSPLVLRMRANAEQRRWKYDQPVHFQSDGGDSDIEPAMLHAQRNLLTDPHLLEARYYIERDASGAMRSPPMASLAIGPPRPDRNTPQWRIEWSIRIEDDLPGWAHWLHHWFRSLPTIGLTHAWADLDNPPGSVEDLDEFLGITATWDPLTHVTGVRWLNLFPPGIELRPSAQNDPEALDVDDVGGHLLLRIGDSPEDPHARTRDMLLDRLPLHTEGRDTYTSLWRKRRIEHSDRSTL